MPRDNRRNPLIYRMTHIDNMQHILQYGITSRLSSHADPEYRSIGDQSLISTRDEFIVPVPPDGSLGTYIPFYFGYRSPMLYVIAHGYNNVNRVPQENIVYLVSDLQHIQNTHLPFVFTDGHAYNEVTQFYTAGESARTIDLEWSMIEATIGTTQQKIHSGKELKKLNF